MNSSLVRAQLRDFQTAVLRVVRTIQRLVRRIRTLLLGSCRDSGVAEPSSVFHQKQRQPCRPLQWAGFPLSGVFLFSGRGVIILTFYS